VSWLKRKDGLLRGDTLDRLDSVLTEKHSRFGRAEPLYNHYWARRYLQASDGGDGPEDTSPRALASQRDVVEHRERFRYLLLSMRHNVFFQSLPALTIVLFVALMGGGLYIQQIQENRRLERIVTAGQLQASGLWDKLSGWTPTPGPDYVDVLWEIRAASPEVRKEFVAQSRLNPNIQAIGLRPQPIVRAVGLLWPEQARQTISDSVTLALEDPKNAAGWQTSSLACASAVLNERLNKACMDRAVAHAKKDILQGDWTTTQDLWSNGRILACMGPWFDSETQNTAIKHIFSSEKIQDSTPNDWEVGAAALAVNSGAWLVQTQQRALTLDELGVINKIVGAVIDALAKKPSDEWASTRARYLASLIAVLPLEDQRAALKRIIAVVATLPAKDDATTELLLVLAQVSELVAEHHRKQGAADMLRPLISEAWNRVKSSPLEDPAVSRLILPLVEVAGANGEVRAGIHGLIDPPNPGNAALVGLWGRHLAVWPVPKGVDRGHEIADKVETAVNLLEAVDKQVTASTDRWLAGEGLARGIAALAKPADLNANAREHALDAAKVALAQTASPEESAAWANAIGSLISTFDKPEQVSTIVEVMKYPNAGLTAREPNAREPQNASDILIRLLVNLVDPKRGEFDWKPGYQIKELRRLLEDGLLKGLDLESAPQDPRPRGPKHNS